MIEEPVQHDTDVAMALLDIAPKLLRRVRADLPLDASSPVWQDVSELRATPGQITLLGVLIEHERCMMQELAEHLAVTPSTVTAMVKRLLAEGYVERTRQRPRGVQLLPSLTAPALLHYNDVCAISVKTNIARCSRQCQRFVT